MDTPTYGHNTNQARCCIRVGIFLNSLLTKYRHRRNYKFDCSETHRHPSNTLVSLYTFQYKKFVHYTAHTHKPQTTDRHPPTLRHYKEYTLCPSCHMSPLL